MIPQSIIESLKEREGILELIGESVQLNRSGSRFSGLCPFHQEKTPSFYVNPEESFYHCFGCGKHGDVFSFIMETRNFSFIEAVKYLADRQGVQLPVTAQSRSESDQERKAKKVRNLLRELLFHVSEIYQEELNSSSVAASYFSDRGLTPKVIEEFKLGFAPDGWNFILERLQKRIESLGTTNLPLDSAKLSWLLSSAGLLKKSQKSEKGGGSSSSYDVFRNRVVFPVCRSDGAPVAFGARLLSKSSTGPKYINSPESLVYEKRKTFFGLPQALKSIRATREVYVVEGYMDVLSLHRAGVENVVATCGTAMTEGHVSVLKRLTDGVIMVYDGDKAGLKSAAMSFRNIAGSGLESRVSLLPKDEDPDSLVSRFLSEGKDPTEYFRENRQALLDLFLAYQLFGDEARIEEGGRLSSDGVGAAKKGKAAEELGKILAQIVNPVEREVFLNMGSSFLDVSRDSIGDLVRSFMDIDSRRQTVLDKGSKKNHYTQVSQKVLSPIESEDALGMDAVLESKFWSPAIWERAVVQACLVAPQRAVDFEKIFLEFSVGATDSCKLRVNSQLVSFLETLSSGNFKALPEGVDSLQTVLDNCGIGECGFMEEALYLTQFKKYDLELVFLETRATISRLAVKNRIATISRAERAASESGASEEEVLNLIQRKRDLKRRQQGYNKK